jgi:hypothetical protein
MSQYAFGHALRIKPYTDKSLELKYAFQNFFINGTATHSGNTYGFVPFGFSGVTVNRTGDGLEATVVFPNNDVTRSWAVEAIDYHWIMEVDVLIIDETNSSGNHQIVHTYVGQVTGGQWDNVSLNLQLSSVLDAVGTDVPRRSLNRKLVGNLPITSNVRLQ